MQNIISYGIKIAKILECPSSALNGFENYNPLLDQLYADLYFDGINTEIKEQVIQELADKLTTIGENIIVMKHD